MNSSVYKNLLYPTDFSDQSVHILGKLLQDNQYNKADFYILHTFRLISSNTNSSNLVEAKRMLEDNSKNAFDKLDQDLFTNQNIPHHFLSDVGFLSDRIQSNIKQESIDLLVLCDDIRKELQYSEGIGMEDFINSIPCDVLLFPEEKLIVKDHNRR